MTAWIDNTLDELDSHLRAYKRELSRREWELSWLGEQGLARVHNLDAVRRQHPRTTDGFGALAQVR